MKKLSLFLVMTIMCMATVIAAPTDKPNPADFMTRYKALVEKVEAINPDKVDYDELDSLKLTYKKLTRELKVHKKAMSNDQLESYYSYKARYQKKIAILKTRRSAKAVKGWVEGMF